ncbi:DUF128 domain-containing protein [Methanolacinia petrolearia]|uniref:DUF128 domain-containing protein n=1 Tax=Methanolacinia petrolearia TaxID=54120 RepID=UPI003BAC4250
MSFIRSERKSIEILRILKDHPEPVGAKRLSELMSERGFVLTDRAVQYYLSYLDDMGFTKKVGNRGRLLTAKGISETERALVDERIGFIISRLEKLAFKSDFNPETGRGNVGYNLSVVPEDQVNGVSGAFDEVIESGYSFFSRYKIIDTDPRIPSGYAGFLTVCSITMDGVLQKMGVPVRMAYGGVIDIKNGKSLGFSNLIGYRGTTIDPLSLFITSGNTSIGQTCAEKAGSVLANVRQVPQDAADLVSEGSRLMRECGFLFPVDMGSGVLNTPVDPCRISLIAYSGMNLIGNAVEKGFELRNEIGAGNMPFSFFE